MGEQNGHHPDSIEYARQRYGRLASINSTVTPQMEELARLHSGCQNDPYRPYAGVEALFNGDLHTRVPGWAPREDWTIISPYIIKHTPPKGEVVDDKEK